MWRRTFLGAAGAAAWAANRRPNIVLILADDLGWGDISSYNPESKIATPAVDRIAGEGVRFTDAHSGSAVCTPTRYGLLTGRYAWRTRLKSHVLTPYDPPLIEAGRLTLPGLLQRHGYRTACIGKWHLGWDWPRSNGEVDFTRPIANGPVTRGFDYYFGADVPNYPPYCFLENDRTVGLPTALRTERALDGEPGAMLPGWKFDRVLPTLVDKAKTYLRQQAEHRRPFFLYFPLTSPHQPIRPSAEFLGKSGINVLADFILQTDWAVGEVLKTLDEARLGSDTLVLFMADNGHSTASGLQELLGRGHRPSGPWRGYKGEIYEGGHRVPFVARWPGRIRPGSTSGQTICLGDMLATCGSILGARLPADAGEDSYDILPALTGSPTRPIRDYTVHHGALGQFAIRQGPWKFIPAWQPEGKVPARYHAMPDTLFNLADDPGEEKNLASARPEIVNRLAALLARCRQEGRSRFAA